MKNNGASDTNNGSQSEEKQTSTNDTTSTSMENQPLHERLTAHLQDCLECQTIVQQNKTQPIGLGMTSKLCSAYQDIILKWAENEGKVNNIVDHDEYGNQASTKVYDTYPEAWRM